ncbi:MAG: hypothetical protein CM1200mP37_6150 [Chloroflexota bacterium]|nr:MAG: hypothetical protein CM1200mP37_6150 [Chloroflexota bacterium]
MIAPKKKAGIELTIIKTYSVESLVEGARQADGVVAYTWGKKMVFNC